MIIKNVSMDHPNKKNEKQRTIAIFHIHYFLQYYPASTTTIIQNIIEDINNIPLLQGTVNRCHERETTVYHNAMVAIERKNESINQPLFAIPRDMPHVV
jgi:hypothetical protein